MRQAALGSIASSLESWSCGPSQMPESERRRRRSPTACGLNSAPLRIDDLKGRVVLVEFWTFGCYNCRNVEPYMKQWYQKYADQGFVVIGVHSPEFTYEHDSEKVRRYLKDHDIRFPVSIDNDFSTWNRYGNRYWPAMYLIDKQGVIRHVRIGEGGYQETEQLIQSLLHERS
jgi:thiol-disulfide isomerase/thioredoxin